MLTLSGRGSTESHSVLSLLNKKKERLAS